MNDGLVLPLIGACVLVGSLASSTAWAQSEPVPGVGELLELGLADRRAGRLHSAVRQFERAYELESSPRAAVQLALTLAQLERWVDAEVRLLEAQAQPDDEFVRRRAAAIERALEVVQEQLGSIELRGGEAGARVLVDRVDRGSLPLPPIRVVLGDHQVEVLHSTGTVRREVRVGENQRSALIELPESGAPDEATGESGRSASTDGGEGSPFRAAGAVTLGLGVVGLALGMASSLRIRKLADDPDLLATRASVPITDGDVCDNDPIAGRVRDICDRYPRLRALQTAGYVAAGVGLVATIALWVAAHRASGDGQDADGLSTNPRWRLSVEVDRRVASLHVLGHF